MKLLFFILSFLVFSLACTVAIAQENVTIKGIVKDVAGSTPKLGVNVQLGTPPISVAKTNDKGEFTATVPLGAKLLFSFSGFADVERVVTLKDTSEIIEVYMQVKQDTVPKVITQNNVTIKGVVKDEAESIPKMGVTVQSGTPLKPIAISNEDGEFTINVPLGTKLLFSFSGYTDTEKTIASEDTSDVMEIYMQIKQDAMQQVVVQGFRNKTRELNTGASTVLSGKAVQDVPVSNLTQLLQGKVAGLNVQNNTGSPGAMGTINLRGLSSIGISPDGLLTPTSPLFVIDGVPVDVNQGFEYGFQSAGVGVNPLSMIPPEDIEQFDVLKDAAATSQYGSRATYGVILITTKRGRSAVPIVEYSGNYFVNTVPKLRDIYGGKGEREIRLKSILEYDTSLASGQNLINQFPSLSDSLNPFYNNSTNWQQYYLKPSYNHQHNISIRGGTHIFNYKTNLNYFQETGIVENTGFRRYGLNMNALYQPVDKFRMLASFQGSLGLRQNGSGIGLVQSGLASSVNTSSLLPPPSLFSENNETLAAASITNDNKAINIQSNFDIQYEPVAGLRFGNVLSFQFLTNTSEYYRPSFLNSGQSEIYNNSDKSSTLYNRTTMAYNKSINEKQNFSVTAFNELNSYGIVPTFVRLIETPNDQIRGPLGTSFASSAGGVFNNRSETRQHGYGGDVAYSYTGNARGAKYVINGGIRMDGLSSNGPSQGYTKNPYVSARWNFGNERIFDESSWLSYGSIRGSWGRSIRPQGNIFDVYGKYVVGLPYNNNPTVTVDYNLIPNDDFKPEIKTESNIGLEFGLFDYLFDVTLDAYYRSLDNQIFPIDLPDISGFNELKSNAVSLVNYGVEWNVSARIFNPGNISTDRRKFGWTFSVVGAINRDVLTKLPNNLRQYEKEIKDNGGDVPVVYKIGRNAISNLLYYTSGIYANTSDVPVNGATGLRQQLDASNSGFYFQGGDPKWIDINGDYIIDASDLQPIGNPIPRVTGGFTSSFSYAGFQLNLNWSYTLVRDVLNSSIASRLQAYTNPTNTGALLPIDNYNYWKPTNINNKNTGTPNATYPNPFDFRRAQTLQPFRTNQTLFLEDGSYWKFNNVVLSYNFNRDVISKYRMNQFRLTLTVNNVLMLSKYKGPNPELVTALGRDYSSGYPAARSFAVGVNIQF